MTRPFPEPHAQTSAFRQGQLRLLETIGSGGFGTVYRAEIVGEMGFRKAVAVKVLSEEGSTDAEIVRRLRDEAKILGLLHHRAIVGVDDLLQVDGRWAVVMELVDGEDLARLMERGPIPARVVAEISREAALALSAAHTATHPDTGEPLQVIHRDIKPANIKLTSAGEVKVLDFGVARARFASREAETRAIRFGSPGYIAPERFDGEDSAASDVYSLGAVLVECLLGERLGRLPMSRSQHPAAVERAIARVLDPASDLAGIAMAMLAYEPEDRPSAGEAARRLRVAALSGDGPWLSEWAPALFSSVRGNTVPRVSATSADTLDIPPSSASLLEPLPPLTAEESLPPAVSQPAVHTPQRKTPSLPPRVERAAGAPPSFSAEPAPASRPLPAAITFDEPDIGPFVGAADAAGPSLGLTGPLPDIGVESEPKAPERKAPVAAFVGLALLAIIGVGTYVSLSGEDAAVVPDAPLQPEPAVVDAALAPPEPTVPPEAPPDPAPEPATPAATEKEPTRPAQPSTTAPIRSTPAGLPGPVLVKEEVKVSEPVKVEPVPVEAAAAPRGTVVVTGQVDEVVLFSADGARHRPGRLEVGRYEVAWRFGEGELVRAGVSVEVAEGKVITLFCGASTGSCRALH